MSRYDTLPEPPSEVSASNILQRMVDGLGFRYAFATEGLTAEFFDFKACDTAMSGGELMKHVYQLMWWVTDAFKLDNPYDKTLNSVNGYRKATLEKIEALSNHINGISDEDLSKVQLYLKRTDTTYSFWYLINGPIADALTHVGQIVTWRRINGNPINKVSPLNGLPL